MYVIRKCASFQEGGLGLRPPHSDMGAHPHGVFPRAQGPHCGITFAGGEHMVQLDGPSEAFGVPRLAT